MSSAFGPDRTRAPRRLVIYVVYDPRGDVDEFIPVALSALRAHADRILVVVNGALTDDGRATLNGVADEVLVRPNEGFDIWGHKAGIDHVGEELTEYDEVVLTNDTWFGPVRPFAPVFERMDALDADFWGMTDHPELDAETSWTGEILPYHLQSFWIAVRRPMLQSAAWRRYWRDLPAMPGYFDAVLQHEIRFTARFVEEGFTSAVVLSHERYDTENPSVFNADEMMDDGGPLLKRKPLFFWPPTMEHYGSIGRWTIDSAESDGYDRGVILANLAKNSPPRDFNVDAGLIDVLSDVDETYDHSRPLRILAIAHIFYVDMVDEMIDLFDHLPGPYDLVVTTPDEERASEIRRLLDSRPRGHRGASDVRVVASNDGRDQSAFLIGCRDVLLDGGHDVVVKIHSKKTPQQGYAVGRHFKDQQFENLLAGPGYAANLLALFQREPGLGLAFPPMIHLGHGTLGHAWWSNRPRFEEIASMLGVRVPLDGVSPLAPFGSMYAARPDALRILAEHSWRYEDFGGAQAYRDGGLAHVLERMPSYAAGELGYHTRVVMNADYVAASHTALEFALDEMSATIPGDPRDRLLLLQRLGWFGTGKASDFLAVYLRANHPRLGERFTRLLDRLRRSR